MTNSLVYVLCLERYGVRNVSIYTNEDAVYDEIFQFARENWSLVCSDPLPAENEKLLDLFGPGSVFGFGITRAFVWDKCPQGIWSCDETESCDEIFRR